MVRKKRISIIETTLVPLPALLKTFQELLPEVRISCFVDDSMIQEINEVGTVTPNVIRRYCTYAVEAERIGSDLIFNQCSTVSEVVDIAQRLVSIPILKTDLPMAEEAVEIGTRIGIVATARVTLGPSERLIKSVAQKRGKSVDVIIHLCEGAFDRLKKGDREGHDFEVKRAIAGLDGSVDVITLAQGSMAALLPELSDVKTPILTSLRSGVLRAKEMIGL
ncbi:MAG: Asp/Glu/hydantoin racemase [Spirochaetes bacterium]|nr:Asp/Glu/hydantoin racemase [Spirochaetota bacterium]